jgi:hypothetical protein
LVDRLKDVLFRFIVGGLVVSAFSALGDVLKPKSWTGMGCSGRCRSVMANDFDFDLANAAAVTRPSFPFEIGLSSSLSGSLRSSQWYKSLKTVCLCPGVLASRVQRHHSFSHHSSCQKCCAVQEINEVM